MQLQFLHEKLPIYYLELSKAQTDFADVQAVVNRLKTLIDEHEVARFIADFDHFSHTAGLEQGDIAPGLVDARNIVFCFGERLPNAEALAITPHTIGVAETRDAFRFVFLQLPQTEANDTMQHWVKSLVNPPPA